MLKPWKNWINENDHLENFVRRFGAKATKAKQAQSRVKMLAKLEDQKKELSSGAFEASTGRGFSNDFGISRRSGREVFGVDRLSIGYGSQELCSGISFLIERENHKVAVIESNGIGKSTLVKTIVGDVEKISGSFLLGHNVDLCYFAQNPDGKA